MEKIILTLGTSLISKVSDIIDDDENTVQDLWDGIVNLQTNSNAQAIISIEQELEALHFEDFKNW